MLWHAIRRIASEIPARLTGRRFRRKPGCMTGDRIPSLIMQIIDELRVRGIMITSRAGEWCVNFRNGAAATAYVTDDLQDAFARGRATAAEAAEPPEREPPARRLRRRRWRPRTAKAARRAFIRKHNRKMRRQPLRHSLSTGDPGSPKRRRS
jgi:hypothetical protein